MKNYRTLLKYRETYRYHFVNGDMKEIFPNDSVTSDDIAFLHHLDDEEVNQEHRQRYIAPLSYDQSLDLEELDCDPLFWDEHDGLEKLLRDESEQAKAQLILNLHEAMKSLTLKQKRTIDKIFYQGMSQSEVAREEGISKASVTDRLAAAFLKLRKNLKKISKNTLLS